MAFSLLLLYDPYGLISLQLFILFFAIKLVNQRMHIYLQQDYDYLYKAVCQSVSNARNSTTKARIDTEL